MGKIEMAPLAIRARWPYFVGFLIFLIPFVLWSAGLTEAIVWRELGPVADASIAILFVTMACCCGYCAICRRSAVRGLPDGVELRSPDLPAKVVRIPWEQIEEVRIVSKWIDKDDRDVSLLRLTLVNGRELRKRAVTPASSPAFGFEGDRFFDCRVLCSPKELETLVTKLGFELQQQRARRVSCDHPRRRRQSSD